MERPFLGAKGTISKFLPLYHVIISNLHIYSLHAQFPTCTDVHLKQFCMLEKI